MCDMKKMLEVNFFDFTAERVWLIGKNVTEEIDKELEQLIQQVREVLDPHLWNRYELRDSLYHDQMMYYAYKQGFIDALRLFEEPQSTK